MDLPDISHHTVERQAELLFAGAQDKIWWFDVKQKLTGGSQELFDEYERLVNQSLEVPLPKELLDEVTERRKLLAAAQ
jgi:hypothetical protein